MAEVRERRRGATTVSSTNQITIPADALRSAGLEVGDRVIAHADDAGRVVLEREHDVIAEFAGALTGTYHPGESTRRWIFEVPSKVVKLRPARPPHAGQAADRRSRSGAGPAGGR